MYGAEPRADGDAIRIHWSDGVPVATATMRDGRTYRIIGKWVRHFDRLQTWQRKVAEHEVGEELEAVIEHERRFWRGGSCKGR